MNLEGPFAVEALGPCRRVNPMIRQGNVNYVEDRQRLMYDPHERLGERPPVADAHNSFELAGPRRQIYFEPTEVRVGVVTCGGLAPGLNAVIRGIVMQLWYLYGCRDIVGIRYGFQGLAPDGERPMALTPEGVNRIRSEGGTCLGSSRGTPATGELVDSLVRNRIDILFTIGGDGTMRGAAAIHGEARRRGLELAIVGVPKTIDNDIPYVFETFGFETAVEEATKAINRAQVEAEGVPYGIGLVKLMGRHAGFIAMAATLASGQANFCLIPEVSFGLEGPGGLFELVEERLRRRRHAVIAVAEGAGQNLMEESGSGHDASGNRKLSDIGLYLKDQLLNRFAGGPLPVTLKYIDPSYLIRAAPPIPADQRYCDLLARNAVHAAMAGKVGMMVGMWHGCMTHVPIRALEGEERRANPDGETWFNVRENTGQPHVIGSPVCELDAPGQG